MVKLKMTTLAMADVPWQKKENQLSSEFVQVFRRKYP